MLWIVEVKIHSNPTLRSALVVVASSKEEAFEQANFYTNSTKVWHEPITARDMGNSAALDEIANYVSNIENEKRHVLNVIDPWAVMS